MNRNGFHFLQWIVLVCILLQSAAFADVADQSGPAPLAGRKAPLFELEDLTGSIFRLSDLRGSAVLLNFWAVRCAPCAEEMPSLNRLHRALAPGGFSVAAITIDRSVKLVRDFVDAHGLAFPVLLDRDQEVAFDSYAVLELPMSFLVDRSGTIVAIFQGPREWDSAEMQQMIRQVMNKEGKGTSQ